MRNKEINLVLLDDHKVVVDGICSLLSDDPSIVVKEVFTNGKDTLQYIEQSQKNGIPIHVVVADLRMPGSMSGLDFTAQLRSLSPTVKVLILSMSIAPEDISAAIRMGVSGYLSKNQDVHDIRKAILEIMRDNRPYYSQEILQSFAESVDRQPVEEIRQLTPRELEILKLIAQEFTTGEIANQLFISEATVDTHRRNMIQKLRAKSIVGLANFAIRHGLV
ncbi:response regulator [Spirosoma linguale]|uniref:Two component transcriptional regulator, LuxR family n=1 Tax=Spirosoma linguale (strain ATCC 33905 / DSM 74 / LMG 10896 / Claus 1) TaxID=504472 RepID=D2QUG4_SPILD|nr:two component transcriptional regulator, LuxR family [Spirosoma linguale DSM 74]